MESVRGRAVAGACLAAVLAVGVLHGAQVAAADAPVVSLGDASGLERDAVAGSVFVPLYLSEPSTEPVVVSYFTANGTAAYLPPEERVSPESFGDYQRRGSPEVPRTVTIPAGTVQTAINVPLGIDDQIEPDENFSVVISSVTGGAVIGDDTGVATIVDADAVSGANPAITVSSTSVHEGDSGQRRAQFQIHLSRAPTSNVTISYSTADGSATAGSDYTAKLPGTVVFAPGQISKSIDVAITPNTTIGGARDLRLDVVVAGGSPVEEIAMSGVATIVDDEVPDTTAPVLSLPADITASASAPNGADVTWTATATDDLDGTVPVACSAASGDRFVVGGTVVSCTATDAAGNTAAGSFTVTVAGFVRPVPVTASGSGHTCVIVDDGEVRCTGFNREGQLGDGTTTSSLTPVPVIGLSAATRISTSSDHTCVVLGDATVRCWGDGTLSKLGVNVDFSATPLSVPSLAGLEVLDVQAGAAFNCALIADGTVRCWGYNGNGELGRGSYTPTNTVTAAPVLGLSDVIAISAGDYHACAVRATGEVRCWGIGTNGRLGDGTTPTRRHTPGPVTGIDDAVSVASGASHTCALLADATARCWGNNQDGRLGDGTTTQATTPVPVVGLTELVDISAGGIGTCAQGESGDAWCWGSNTFGGIGDGTTAQSTVPVAVAGLAAPVTSLDVGNSTACARLTDGATRCWGSNSYGQLGNGGATTPSGTARGLTDPGPFTSLATGSSHTCAVRDEATVGCWGLNTNGQLGNGTNATATTATEVSGVSGAVSVATGTAHSCAVLVDGTATCWGLNTSGQLGNGTTTSTTTPVPVTGLDDVAEIAVFGTHSCARLTDGTARCWGDNADGQLGDGTTTNATTPVAVTGLAGVVDISVGWDRRTDPNSNIFNPTIVTSAHSCAVVDTGEVRCWGRNSRGQLGVPTTTASSSVPVQVAGLTDAAAVVTGGRHACALRDDGTVACWGSNARYELGQPSGSGSSAPLPVAGLTGVVALSAANSHVCALRIDGTAACWGDNASAQLGDGNVPPTVSENAPRIATPTTVLGLTGADSISTGLDHSCARLASGSAVCWGDNTGGRLGIGLPYSALPSPMVGVL